MPLGVRSDFKPELFTALIVEKGYNCMLQHAIPCGNIDTYTHAHPKDCKYCHGTGFVYYDSVKTKVILTSLEKDKRFITSPELLLGQTMVTVDSVESLQYRDRIINLDSLIRYSQLVKRQSNSDIDELRFKIFEIENVYRYTNSGELMDIENFIDYEITDDNKIKWISSNKPDPNEIYSIRYKTHPSWIVTSFPHIIRATTTRFLKPHESPENLPLQGIAKLEFLFYKDQLNYVWEDFYE